MAEDSTSLHLAILPWLAFGHLIPFLQLSIALAKSGHRISFISTPRNIDRILPKVPHHLLSLITFISLPLPRVDGLPEHAESTNDTVSIEQSELLKAAYDLLQHPLKQFLSQSSTDWIIHDFSAHWAGAVAREFGVQSVLFCTFPAAVMTFWGPIDLWTEEERRRCWPTPKSLTTKPKWIPFPSEVAFKNHEAEIMYPLFLCSNKSGLSDIDRLRLGSEGCDAITVRSCSEYEGEHLELFSKFYRKPVIPVGLLPPVMDNSDRETTTTTTTTTTTSTIFRWLDERQPKSVVFVSFGSEYKLNQGEVSELAYGLEMSNVPFLWALRRPSWLTADYINEALPDGFMDRIKGRGFVTVGWAPQLEILAHSSVGGSLFHCGMGSIVETLRYGHVLILMPLIFDQGLNARFLAEKGVGIEVERNEDGFFSRDEIARCLRMAMVSDEGEALRAKAREMGDIFGDQVLHDHYVKKFAEYLRNTRKKLHGLGSS